MVTRLAWIAQRFVSSNNTIRACSAACLERKTIYEHTTPLEHTRKSRTAWTSSDTCKAIPLAAPRWPPRSSDRLLRSRNQWAPSPAITTRWQQRSNCSKRGGKGVVYRPLGPKWWKGWADARTSGAAGSRGGPPSPACSGALLWRRDLRSLAFSLRLTQRLE